MVMPTLPSASPPATQRWRLALGLLLSAGVVALVVRSWPELLAAIGLARDAQPSWLLAALAVILASYMLSGQVLRLALAPSGHRLSSLRAWLTALVAILISQSVPAGGVGSYAFLVSAFRRRGVALGTTALVASLEMISYALAMALIALFSLIYLLVHVAATGAAGGAFVLPLLVGLALLAGLVAGAAALTRNLPALARRLQGLHARLARLRRRPCNVGWGAAMAARVAQARALIGAHRRMLALLVGIQLAALCGHSLAMLLILLSLGVHASFAVVLAAFGAALITSLFNVLPGGGGTIETILAAVLGFLAVGPAAVPAAIIFRLLNFWLLLPLAAPAYAWIMRGQPKPAASQLIR